jgi:cell shape-determining protein MreC
MQSTEALPKRSYILYILFILLSSLLILIDYFSNKELSSYFPNSVNFEFEIENSDFTFIQRFDTLFEQRAQLVSENIRLEQEVQDLRSLEIVNQELQLQLESYEAISTVSNIQNFELLSSGFITKNLNLEYLIYGGTNQQLEVGDLVINEKGFVVGYLREVFYSYSILESPYSSDFNLEVMDKYNNTYLITSNGSEMFISSILIDNYKDDIDFLYTDISFNHSGKFPVVDTTLINFEFQNNQINASVKFLDSFTFNTKLFIPKFK